MTNITLEPLQPQIAQQLKTRARYQNWGIGEVLSLGHFIFIDR